MLWKIFLPIILIAVAALIAVALFVARTPAVQKPVPPPTLLVDVAVAERAPVTFVVRSQGVVAPRTRTTMVSEVSGTVVEVSPGVRCRWLLRQGRCVGSDRPSQLRDGGEAGDGSGCPGEDPGGHRERAGRICTRGLGNGCGVWRRRTGRPPISPCASPNSPRWWRGSSPPRRISRESHGRPEPNGDPRAL